MRQTYGACNSFNLTAALGATMQVSNTFSEYFKLYLSSSHIRHIKTYLRIKKNYRAAKLFKATDINSESFEDLNDILQNIAIAHAGKWM